MTPADLTRIKDYLEKATEGPWRVFVLPELRMACVTDAKETNPDPKTLADCFCYSDEQDLANAEFIAQARTDLSLLVKAVEDKDKALARVLKYLRTPDAEDAEYIERLIENALNPKAKR